MQFRFTQLVRTEWPELHTSRSAFRPQAQDDKNVIRTSPWRWRSAGKLAALLTVRFCSSEGLFLAVDEPSGRNQIAIGV
jgi:hypothetical protein